MAVSAKLFGAFPCTALGGSAGAGTPIDILSDTIKVALTSSSYTVAQTTHDFFDDVTNELTTTGGYTAGGATLASPTNTFSSLVTTFDAADTSWTSATFTARISPIYKSTGTASTSPLVGYVDFGADQSVSSGTFTIQWNASGIYTITVA